MVVILTRAVFWLVVQHLLDEIVSMAGRVATYVQGFHLPAAASMPYRAFGASGRVVSAYSLGASALGSVFHDIDEGEGIETVRHAIRSGVNLVDAAPWYGFGKAETVLGKALRGVPREGEWQNPARRRGSHKPPAG